MQTVKKKIRGAAFPLLPGTRGPKASALRPRCGGVVALCRTALKQQRAQGRHLNRDLDLRHEAEPARRPSSSTLCQRERGNVTKKKQMSGAEINHSLFQELKNALIHPPHTIQAVK